MFKKSQNEPTGLDLAIDRLHQQLTHYTGNSKEYADTVDQLAKLYKIRNDHGPDRISKDTLAIIAGNLSGILVILAYERAHVVASKALGFVMKTR